MGRGYGRCGMLGMLCCLGLLRIGKMSDEESSIRSPRATTNTSSDCYVCFSEAGIPSNREVMFGFENLLELCFGERLPRARICSLSFRQCYGISVVA